MRPAVGLDKGSPKPAMWDIRPMICSVTLGERYTPTFSVCLRAATLYHPQGKSPVYLLEPNGIFFNL